MLTSSPFNKGFVVCQKSEVKWDQKSAKSDGQQLT